MSNPTVCLSTHCYSGDRGQLYKNLDKIIESHNYKFDEVQVVHQRCGIDPNAYFPWVRNIFITEEDYDRLLINFNIPTEDPRADELTHGKESAHYWKNHVVNHLTGAEYASSDYIVFSDSDCVIIRNEPNSWIEEGINYLEENPKCFAVSPCDGAPGKQWIMSQQLFLAKRFEFLNMDFNCWDGKFIDGGPMQEYYPMMEGRISMFMLKYGLYRYVLSENHRYFHDWEHHKEPKELYDLAIKALA